MASILSSKYRYSETYSAGTIFHEELRERHRDNVFITSYSQIIVDLLGRLQQSIAFHEQDSLAKQGDELEASFKRSYTKFRKMVEMMAPMKEFGIISEKCKTITSVLNHHDRDLHMRARDEHINLFASVITECRPDDENTIIKATPEIEILFQNVLNDHTELKRLEQHRSIIAQTAEAIPAPSEIAKEITPYISKIYRHLKDFASINNEEYKETLQAIDVRLAPIVTRVKARLTRAEHAAAEAEEENENDIAEE